MKKSSKIIFSLIFALIFVLFLVRLFSPVELDDVSPLINCEKNLIEKADILWVIPKYENSTMNDFPEWVDYTKSTNKILGLHGVYHTYNEFSYERDEDYLNAGVEDFEKTFGYNPVMFKAPQLELSQENKKMIKNQGLEVKGRWNQLTHKVYHCEDKGLFPNWFIRVF